jgi:hypothetical protein
MERPRAYRVDWLDRKRSGPVGPGELSVSGVGGTCGAVFWPVSTGGSSGSASEGRLEGAAELRLAGLGFPVDADGSRPESTIGHHDAAWRYGDQVVG